MLEGVRMTSDVEEEAGAAVSAPPSCLVEHTHTPHTHPVD